MSFLITRNGTYCGRWKWFFMSDYAFILYMHVFLLHTVEYLTVLLINHFYWVEIKGVVKVFLKKINVRILQTNFKTNYFCLTSGFGIFCGVQMILDHYIYIYIYIYKSVFLLSLKLKAGVCQVIKCSKLFQHLTISELEMFNFLTFFS